jgi:hypothetical protein
MENIQTEGLTFEKVWAMFQETDRIVKENALEMQEIAKRFQETDKKFQETEERFQETDRIVKEVSLQMKETDKKISRLGSRIGDLIEHFAAANVIEKFQDLGYEFTRASRNITIEDKNRRSLAEVDIFLENGDSVMAVEVKTNLAAADVTEHLHRMDVLRSDADSRGDKRKYLGAIAAALAGKRVKEKALASGFYVLEQQGDNVRITAPANKRVW